MAGAQVLYHKLLISLRNRFENAFAQIDVPLQRCLKLISNLVETASAYMKHKSDTLTALTEARNMASKKCVKASADPDDGSLMEALSKVAKRFRSCHGSLNMAMENYPDLKAVDSMQELHEDLASTGNRVAFSRQAFKHALQHLLLQTRFRSKALNFSLWRTRMLKNLSKCPSTSLPLEVRPCTGNVLHLPGEQYQLGGLALLLLGHIAAK